MLKHIRMLHTECRKSVYPLGAKVPRFIVPDEKVPWDIPWNEYKPPFYTADFVNNKPWADPDIFDKNFKPKWNTLDGLVNRQSHVGQYNIVKMFPLNPIGRTGLAGRGVLGKWGPNHAADPVVTRWKTISNMKVLNEDSNKPILQFVAIQRRDTGEWAIPGGMVDPGEVISATLKREFLEEALNSLEKNKSELAEIKRKIESLFKNGEEIYRGYVDDPRNTDNAWMETVAMQFHDEKGDCVAMLPLCAGDDAVGVRWMDVNKEIPLYANHCHIISEVAIKMKSHW